MAGISALFDAVAASRRTAKLHDAFSVAIETLASPTPNKAQHVLGAHEFAKLITAKNVEPVLNCVRDVMQSRDAPASSVVKESAAFQNELKQQVIAWMQDKLKLKVEFKEGSDTILKQIRIARGRTRGPIFIDGQPYYQNDIDEEGEGTSEVKGEGTSEVKGEGTAEGREHPADEEPEDKVAATAEAIPAVPLDDEEEESNGDEEGEDTKHDEQQEGNGDEQHWQEQFNNPQEEKRVADEYDRILKTFDVTSFTKIYGHLSKTGVADTRLSFDEGFPGTLTWKHTARALAHLDLPFGGKFIDIGMNDGKMVVAARYAYPATDLIGIEPPDALDEEDDSMGRCHKARAFMHAMNVTNVNVIEANVNATVAKSALKEMTHAFAFIKSFKQDDLYDLAEKLLGGGAPNLVRAVFVTHGGARSEDGLQYGEAHLKKFIGMHEGMKSEVTMMGGSRFTMYVVYCVTHSRPSRKDPAIRLHGAKVQEYIKTQEKAKKEQEESEKIAFNKNLLDVEERKVKRNPFLDSGTESVEFCPRAACDVATSLHAIIGKQTRGAMYVDGEKFTGFSFSAVRGRRQKVAVQHESTLLIDTQHKLAHLRKKIEALDKLVEAAEQHVKKYDGDELVALRGYYMNDGSNVPTKLHQDTDEGDELYTVVIKLNQTNDDKDRTSLKILGQLEQYYGDAPGSALWFSSKLWHETGATPPGTQKLVLFFGKSDGAGKSDSAGKSDGAGPSDNTDNVAESLPKKKRKITQ